MLRSPECKLYSVVDTKTYSSDQGYFHTMWDFNRWLSFFVISAKYMRYLRTV